MRNRDKALGAYIGAAIGDAMGGPIECTHYMRIKRLVGELSGFLPYDPLYMVCTIGNGYALHAEPGNVTDDTYIRADFTRFYLDTQPPRTADMLAQWMLANSTFDGWWPPAIEGLRRVERGEATAHDGGDSYYQGGGIGWWTPMGIVHAGDPAAAAADFKELSRIWKAPLERDLGAAAVAALAEGLRDSATLDSMFEAMFVPCGPLATQLIERAIDIAQKADTWDDLATALYEQALFPSPSHWQDTSAEPPRAADGPLPPPLQPLPDAEGFYTNVYWAEQVPLAVAGFVWGQGDPRVCIPKTCMIGRDADSVATTVGAWVGALHGESGLPREWVDTVCQVNLAEIDIRALAIAIAEHEG